MIEENYDTFQHSSTIDRFWISCQPISLIVIAYEREFFLGNYIKIIKHTYKHCFKNRYSSVVKLSEID